MKARFLIAETLVAALLAVPIFAQVKPTDEKVPCRNYKDVLALFDRLCYTPKAWQAGIREIPRCLPCECARDNDRLGIEPDEKS